MSPERQIPWRAAGIRDATTGTQPGTTPRSFWLNRPARRGKDPFAMPKNSLSITDNRTGKSYEIPIQNGCIKTADLRQIRVDDRDFGLMGYDPAFLNTANCKSSITYIDGDKGILEYRGYPIEQLAEKSSYLEVCYLLMNG